MFGLDTRVVRIVYTLGVCYLVYALRSVLFLLLLAVVAAYMLLPAVELASRLLPVKHRRGGALRTGGSRTPRTFSRRSHPQP